MNTTRRLDAIVIGGGPGGCVAAARLADDGREVLLIEAGPGEPRPSSVSGLDPISAAEELSRQWPNTTARISADANPYRYRQGFGLGGGSTINSLLLSRGDGRDYQRWAVDHGCAGWGADDMAPWLSVARDGFPNYRLAPGPVSTGFVSAAVVAGHTAGGSSLEQDRLGVLEARLAAVDGQRISAADAFLWPQGERGTPDNSNVTLVTGRSASRIKMDGRRAVGVVTATGQEFHAPLIVLAAGAVRTPELLLRSALTKRPIGRGLKDHPSFAFTLALRDGTAASTPSVSQAAPPGRAVSTLLRWSSGPDRFGDLQAFVIDRIDDGSSAMPLAVIAVGLMQVSSAGSVTITTQADHHESSSPPAIITGALQTEEDRRRLRDGVAHIGALLRSSTLAPLIREILVDDIGTPISALDDMSDAALDAWIANHPGPYTHPASSCRLGPADDPNAVVSSEPGSFGLLHGYDGIHIVDASVLPDLVSGGLQLPVVAVAERIIADLIHHS